MTYFIWHKEKKRFLQNHLFEDVKFGSLGDVYKYLKECRYPDEYIKKNFCAVKKARILIPEH